MGKHGAFGVLAAGGGVIAVVQGVGLFYLVSPVILLRRFGGYIPSWLDQLFEPLGWLHDNGEVYERFIDTSKP